MLRGVRWNSSLTGTIGISNPLGKVCEALRTPISCPMATRDFRLALGGPLLESPMEDNEPKKRLWAKVQNIGSFQRKSGLFFKLCFSLMVSLCFSRRVSSNHSHADSKVKMVFSFGGVDILIVSSRSLSTLLVIPSILNGN